MTESNNSTPIEQQVSITDTTAETGLVTRDQSVSTLQTLGVDNGSYSQQMQMFAEIVKDSNTGITTVAMAMMLHQKAKELQIPWANAVPHMHLIKGKLGVDIHIIKAIMSRPSSGIYVEKLEDYKPLYEYTDSTYNKVWHEDDLPPTAHKVFSFKEPVPDGMFAVTILPFLEKDKAGTVIGQRIKPIDFRTKYKFTRRKINSEGVWVTDVRIGSFSRSEAYQAQLPLDRNGNVSADSNWVKYEKLMIDHRAYTFTARDIASDLLMGCYETQELYDMEKMDYAINAD